MSLLAIKRRYLNFLDEDERRARGKLIHFILYLLSLIYGAAAGLRNILYDKKIIEPFSSPKKVISVGSICWGGAGKTTLVLYLYERLSSEFKTAVLRRGYGADEENIFKEKGVCVFSSPQRVKIVKNISPSFDVFILDDGFQYRKLKRDLDIVIMGARELKGKFALIPASFFREPLRSLERADILILNYKREMDDPLRVKREMKEKFPHLKVYFSDYKIKHFIDGNNNYISIDYLRQRKCAAFTATGYPQGFLNKVRGLNLQVVREAVYPDHYVLGREEFNHLQGSLLKEGIYDLIITNKDKYHLPSQGIKLNILVMEIEMSIDNEDSFLKEIKSKVSAEL